MRRGISEGLTRDFERGRAGRESAAGFGVRRRMGGGRGVGGAILCVRGRTKAPMTASEWRHFMPRTSDVTGREGGAFGKPFGCVSGQGSSW